MPDRSTGPKQARTVCRSRARADDHSIRCSDALDNSWPSDSDTPPDTCTEPAPRSASTLPSCSARRRTRDAALLVARHAQASQHPGARPDGLSALKMARRVSRKRNSRISALADSPRTAATAQTASTLGSIIWVAPPAPAPTQRAIMVRAPLSSAICPLPSVLRALRPTQLRLHCRPESSRARSAHLGRR